MISTNEYGEIIRGDGDGCCFYAKSGGYGPYKAVGSNERSETMKRLIDLRPMDAANRIYRVPDVTVHAVFDGDVMLEDSLYRIDAIDNRIKLKRSPAFDVRALVSC